jgi:hypothetical protein
MFDAEFEYLAGKAKEVCGSRHALPDETEDLLQG